MANFPAGAWPLDLPPSADGDEMKFTHRCPLQLRHGGGSGGSAGIGINGAWVQDPKVAFAGVRRCPEVEMIHEAPRCACVGHFWDRHVMDTPEWPAETTNRLVEWARLSTTVMATLTKSRKSNAVEVWTNRPALDYGENVDLKPQRGFSHLLLLKSVGPWAKSQNITCGLLPQRESRSRVTMQ